MNIGDYSALASLGFITFASFVKLYAGFTTKPTISEEVAETETPVAKKQAPKEVKKSWNERIGQGLKKTREKIWGGIAPIMGSGWFKERTPRRLRRNAFLCRSRSKNCW